LFLEVVHSDEGAGAGASVVAFARVDGTEGVANHECALGPGGGCRNQHYALSSAEYIYPAHALCDACHGSVLRSTSQPVSKTVPRPSRAGLGVFK
jgi:hypothetical protein